MATDRETDERDGVLLDKLGNHLYGVSRRRPMRPGQLREMRGIVRLVREHDGEPVQDTGTPPEDAHADWDLIGRIWHDGRTRHARGSDRRCPAEWADSRELTAAWLSGWDSWASQDTGGGGALAIRFERVEGKPSTADYLAAQEKLSLEVAEAICAGPAMFETAEARRRERIAQTARIAGCPPTAVEASLEPAGEGRTPREWLLQGDSIARRPRAVDGAPLALAEQVRVREVLPSAPVVGDGRERVREAGIEMVARHPNHHGVVRIALPMPQGLTVELMGALGNAGFELVSAPSPIPIESDPAPAETREGER